MKSHVQFCQVFGSVLKNRRGCKQEFQKWCGGGNKETLTRITSNEKWQRKPAILQVTHLRNCHFHGRKRLTNLLLNCSNCSANWICCSVNAEAPWRNSVSCFSKATKLLVCVPPPWKYGKLKGESIRRARSWSQTNSNGKLCKRTVSSSNKLLRKVICFNILTKLHCRGADWNILPKRGTL